MTKIKLCGLTRPEDIAAANALEPDFVGFVFAPKSRRCVTAEQAKALRNHLLPSIQAVGVFVDEEPERVAALLEVGIIGLAQLHGREDEGYLERLRALTEKTIIQAFPIKTPKDLERAQASSADNILLDSGAGTGITFDWGLLTSVRRPYFLAGGLGPDNVVQAIRTLHPWGVDVSSGIETGGVKDFHKMAAFVAAVRKEEKV